MSTFTFTKDEIQKAIDMWYYQSDNDLGLYGPDFPKEKEDEMAKNGQLEAEMFLYYVNEIRNIKAMQVL